MEAVTPHAIEIALPVGAEGHFRLHVYAVVTRLLANLRATEVDGGYFAAFPFLAGYAEALRACCPPGLDAAAADAWWAAQIAAWEDNEPGHLPLRALRDDMALGDEELRLLVASGLVEEDIRFGALFAALQAPLPARRPCVGMLGWLLAAPGDPPGDAWPMCRALLDRGLLLAENRADPRSEWVLRVPQALWDAMRDQLPDEAAPGLRRYARASFPPPGALVLPAPLLRQVERLPTLLADGHVSALALRGMVGSGRRTVAGAVAGAIGRDLLVVQEATPGGETWRLLGPLATLTGALPLLRCDPGPGEALDLPALQGYVGPAAIALGRGGGLRGALVERALSLSLPSPDAAARRRFWLASGAPVATDALDEIAARFLLNGGHIRRAAGLAATYAALDGRAAIIPADVHTAARALNRQALDTLATHLDPAGGWDGLVVGPSTAEELRGMAARCMAREELRTLAGPAFSASLNHGVRAMFSGPSGTGKTLAARVLAGALGMDLYRVDLAAVVNKYIGETERNLNQVLSRAEELDVVLLLDEGDALMAARTDVRNANDRYANLETNYLLQRLETYEGIVIITTNAGQRIDGAFLRRLDVTVEFAPPEADERLRIWQIHLPARHEVGAALLDEVATRCALTGGQIRNAALHATLLALGAGGTVGAAHLDAALQREYRKAGAAYPMASVAAAPRQVDLLRQFADHLGRKG